MDIQEYIASGILELYVAGSLSEKENQEVYAMMQEHPEVLQEVLRIEKAIVALTTATAPKDASALYAEIKNKLNNDSDTKVIPIQKSNPWMRYAGWAASLVLAIGLIWSVLKTYTLEEQLQQVTIEKQLLEEQIVNARADVFEANKLLTVLRDKNIIAVPLAGQTVAPDAYAKVYWDKTKEAIYLDLQGLPDPPEGKVYQVWSLTLNPLTPTSLGVVENFTADDDKIFDLKNANASEAFGITLEPEGGSESPTLEQLYTLGAITTP